jgi:hypothetical protein
LLLRAEPDDEPSTDLDAPDDTAPPAPSGPFGASTTEGADVDLTEPEA